MNTKHLSFITSSLLLLTSGLFVLNSATAAPGAIADQPLQTSAAAPPNLMFMIDSSGSMNNVVPDSPYNPATDYTPAGCGSTITLQGSTSDIIFLNIVSAVPKIVVGSASAVDIDALCFEGTTNYDGKLNANSGTGDDKTTTGYFEAEYTGNYLNWYFHYDTDNTDPWTNQSMKPAPNVDSRLGIAKVASTNLINGLSNMRVGLARFDGSNGAYFEQNVKTLDSAHKTALTTSINGLVGSSSTPVSETLLDIGRYFVGNGGTNNPGALPSGSTNESVTSAGFWTNQ